MVTVHFCESELVNERSMYYWFHVYLRSVNHCYGVHCTDKGFRLVDENKCYEGRNYLNDLILELCLKEISLLEDCPF